MLLHGQPSGGVECLKVAETLENGIICFSAGKNTAEDRWVIWPDLFMKNTASTSLTSDIMGDKGVKHGQGVAISMRDSGIRAKAMSIALLNWPTKAAFRFT